MVFFNCNACGEAVKKNQVEKHYRQQCRNCEVLSCVDCGKEFWGDEYQQHTKCITEDEKFGGKNYKPKPNANKGEQKQELWFKQVQDAISKVKANPKLKSLLERLKEYPNIPRKQAKFENFLRNSLRVMDSGLATQAYNVISAELNATATEHSSGNHIGGTVAPISDRSEPVKEPVKDQAAESQNGDAEKKKKKRKLEETTVEEKTENKEMSEDNDGTERRKKKKKDKNRTKEESVDEPQKKKQKTHEAAQENKETEQELTDEVESGKFKWEAAIIGVLKRSDDKEISVKKLRKKVLAEFHARGGDGKYYTEERLFAKFTKKINSNPRMKVLKDTVKLVS